MAYIEFDNVVKSYGSGDAEVRALDGASFSVERGELAVVLGASGAGKTTALNILGGMDTATSGRVTVDGRDVTAESESELVEYRRADVGFVFQFYNLVPNLTALENVELAAQICPDSLDARETLEKVGLGARLSNFPSSPEASSSASRSRERWQRTRSCCCATNPRARSTTSRASRSCSCSRTRAATRASLWCSSPTTRPSRPWQTASSTSRAVASPR